MIHSAPIFRRALPVLAAVFCGSPLAAQQSNEASVALDPLLAGKATWSLTAEGFEKMFKGSFFRWMTKSKDRGSFTRRPYSNVSQKLTLFDGKVDVQEAIIDFKDGTVHRVTFSIFNRGDAGTLSRTQFDDTLKNVRTALDTRLAVAGTERGRDNRSAVRAEGMIWNTGELAALLESSAQRGAEFQPEFIRLRLAPPPPRVALGASARAGNVASLGRADLIKNVRRESNGDVVLDVPMVDQGQKGYCVTASCERVFRYYGIECDQHELAQLAETGSGADGSSGGGTRLDKMEETLGRLEGKFKVHIKTLIPWDWKEFQRQMDDYNRFARKNDQPEKDVRGTQIVDLDGFFGDIDPDTLRQARSRGAAFEKFQRVVRDSIDRGIPLLWSLRLGLYPEKPRIPQSAGSHMRLIIGYNDAQKEILYSDSWGSGHELKRMAVGDVYAATSALYAIQPIAH